jgi:hypothetical protein
MIEAFLLAAVVRRRWRSGLLFERAMHAFMSPILLRLAGLDAFGHDTELDPPR